VSILQDMCGIGWLQIIGSNVSDMLSISYAYCYIIINKVQLLHGKNMKKIIY